MALLVRLERRKTHDGPLHQPSLVPAENIHTLTASVCNFFAALGRA